MKAFSLTNAILKQVAEEDKAYWAKSNSYMPPPPKYTKTVIPFTKTLKEALAKEIHAVIRI